MVFTALPIHVNTEQVGDQIKNALEKGQITTVADVRDETDMNGTRFAVVLRANASVQLAKDEIFKYTSLDTKFGANNLAIDGTKLQFSTVRTRSWRQWIVLAGWSVSLPGSITEELSQSVDSVLRSFRV